MSEDHYYDMVEQKYIKPQFSQELHDMIDTEVVSLEDLESRLHRIVAFGFKFSAYFGTESGLLSVYKLLGDRVLTEGYRFKYGIDADTL